MSETKWTPGPWAMPDVEIGIISKFISPGRWDGMIATADCGNFARSRSEGLANARLMSAAPDMYAATDWMNEIAEKGFMCSFLHIPVSDVKDHEKFEIILTGKEIRALIDARRKARGE